jgi:hypothetical protein
MPRRIASLALALITMIASGVALVPAATAQASATVWTEFATVEPGIGCVVDVSIDGGSALAGATVSLVVSDDANGAVISSDSGTANGSGITWLVIDTNGGYAGAKRQRPVPERSIHLDHRRWRMQRRHQAGHDVGHGPGHEQRLVIVVIVR